MQDFQDAIKYLRDEAYQLSQQDRDEQAAEMLAAADALATQPAPLADAALAELEEAYKEASPVLWGAHVADYGVQVFEDENGDGIRPNPYHPICEMEDMGDDKQEAYAVLIKNAVNALPGLLARVRALQAFKEYVHQRFDEANIDGHHEQNAINGCRVGARFDDLERYMQLTDAQKTREALVAVANGLAECIDNQDIQQVYEVWRGIAEVLTAVDSATLSSLRLIQPPTVKGGQPNA